MITTEPMVLLSLSLSLRDRGWSSPMLGCSVSGFGVWQKSVIFQNVGRCPQLALVYFLVTSKHLWTVLCFPYNSKPRNALLHSRSGCLLIETFSSAASLPVTLNTVYDKSLLILYCNECSVNIYNGPPCRKRLKERQQEDDYNGS